MSFRVLMVLTSRNLLQDDKTVAGSWLEELAAPYQVFARADAKVTLASIKGGEAPIDPASLVDPWITDAGRALLDNQAVMAQLAATSALATVNADAHDAVFLVGGAAAMWDFPSDPALGRLLQRMAAQDRITAAVCHGVSGFLNPAAIALVSGRRMTCISDAEDQLAGYDKLVPFMPESALRRAGAALGFAAEPFGCHAVADGNIVTGQNPASAGRSAELVVQALRARAARVAASA